MNKLLAVLVAAAFAAGSVSALAQGTAPAPKQDAMKASSDKDKYKECMKKDASGKEMMDQACKDKMDKAAMSKGGTSTAPAGSMSKDAPKGK
jgi:hypothetical protein